MAQRQNLLHQIEQDVAGVEHRVAGEVRRLPHFGHDHPPVRDVNREFEASFTPLERVALWVTQHVGTPGFFLIILGWTVLWLGWNVLAPAGVRFDPAPAFVFWLFVSNMIQILLMPLIMIGQNLQGRHSELRAESDFEINEKAELEVETILQHLELQAAQLERQDLLIQEILARLPEPGQAKAGSKPGPS